MPEQSSTLSRVKFVFTQVKSPAFWILGLISLFVLSVAFQFPYEYRIDLGGRQGRFLIQEGIYTSQAEEGRTFRWTQDHAVLVIPALTSGSWDLLLGINGWQPEHSATVHLMTGDVNVTREAAGTWRRWREKVNTPAGDLRLVLDSDVFRPSAYGNKDPRVLGVRLDSLLLRPTAPALRMPPLLDYVLPLTLAVLLFYLSVSLLALNTRAALISSGLILAALAGLVAFYRVYLNAGVLLALLVAFGISLFLIVAGLDALSALYRRAGISLEQRELHWLAAILLVALILKGVGTFYPQVFIIDAGFHLNRLEQVERGDLYFVTRSREFGGLETVYPPALYVFISPLGTIAPDAFALVKLAALCIESVGGAVLYWLARNNGQSPFASLLTLVLYLGVPLAFIIFGWGVYANILAQQLLVLSLALWFGLPWKRHAVPSLLLFAFVLMLGILSHASMLAVLTVFWGILAVAVFLVVRGERQRAVLTVLALGIALGVAFVLYFSEFVDKTASNLRALQTSATNTASQFERVVGGGLADDRLGLVPIKVHSVSEWLRASASYFLRESWVYYGSVPVLLALGGMIWMWRQPGMHMLAVTLSSAFITVLIFFMIGMTLNLYTRYMLFGAPFFALGAGYVLGQLEPRAPLARAVIVMGVVLLLLLSLMFWLPRIVD